MGRWLKLGGVLLLVAWGPFLYKELSSTPAAAKHRVLPNDSLSDSVPDDSVELAAPPPTADAERAAAPGKGAPEPAEPEPAEQDERAAPGADREGEAEANSPSPAAPGQNAPAAAASRGAQLQGPGAPGEAKDDAVEDPVAKGEQGEQGEPGEQNEKDEAQTEGAQTREAQADSAEGQPGDGVAPGEGDTQPGAQAEPPPATPPTMSGPAAALRQAYEQQTRDALWAADAEAKISALFGSDTVPQELLRSTSCRQAVCRVELSWSSERASAYASVYQAFGKLLGSEIGVEPVGTLSAQGEQQVNLYLTRKGYTLADLAP